MLKAITSIASGEAGPTLWLRRLRSFLDIRYLALLTSIATYALIVLGGTVRATGSGLACPDWPLCHGQWIPPLESKILIEYSHRLAAVSVGLLILGTAATAWLWQRENRLLVASASLALLLLIAQALVGGVTVNMELPATIVALHLALALVLLAVLIFSTAIAFKPRAGREPRLPLSNGPAATPRASGWSIFLMVASVAALATFALILTGSYVANSGAALVYPDWPLFNGKLVSAGGGLADLHYAHRVMAAVVGLMLVGVAVQAWRRMRRPVLVVMAGFALILYLAQVFVGASNIWLELATPVRVAHLALAAALWGTLVLALTWGYLERRAA